MLGVEVPPVSFSDSKSPAWKIRSHKLCAPASHKCSDRKIKEFDWCAAGSNTSVGQTSQNVIYNKRPLESEAPNRPAYVPT